MTPDPQFLSQRFPEHRRVTRLFACGQWLADHRVPALPGLIQLAIRVVFSADIPLRLRLPSDVVFMHNGLGTVVHGDATFAGPALIYQHVTVGNSLGSREGAPAIGSYVVIGAGATVAGGISIGDYSFVGAGTVLAVDLPAYHRAVGNPAVIGPIDPRQLTHVWHVDLASADA